MSGALEENLSLLSASRRCCPSSASASWPRHSISAVTFSLRRLPLQILLLLLSFSHSVVSDSWTPRTITPPGSSVHGILQPRILEWVAMPSSRGDPRDRTYIFCIGRRILYQCTTKEAPDTCMCVCVCVCVYIYD